MRLRARRAEAGFTLIEIVTVLAVIAVIATIAIVSLRGSWSSGQAGRIEGDITALRSALYEYVTAEGAQTVPAGSGAAAPIGIGSVAEIPGWLQPHLQSRATLAGPEGVGYALEVGKVAGGASSAAIFEAYAEVAEQRNALRQVYRNLSGPYKAAIYEDEGGRPSTRLWVDLLDLGIGVATAGGTVMPGQGQPGGTQPSTSPTLAPQVVPQQVPQAVPTAAPPLVPGRVPQATPAPGSTPGPTPPPLAPASTPAPQATALPPAAGQSAATPGVQQPSTTQPTTAAKQAPPPTTLPANRPRSEADCKGRGWQKYTHLGFSNQGQCIQWVRAHP